MKKEYHVRVDKRNHFRNCAADVRGCAYTGDVEKNLDAVT